MRGNDGAVGVGAADASGCRGGVRRLRAHPGRARRNRRSRRPRARGAAGRRRREFRPAPARRGARAGCSTEAQADPPNPGNANERLPGRGERRARFAEFFAGDRPTVVYFGKLIHNKGVHVLLEALRERRRPGGDRRLRRLPRGARAHGAAAARSSRDRSSTATSSISCRWPTCASCRRSSRRRSGWSPPRPPRPASPPLVARHSGLAEIAAGIESEYPAGAARPRKLRTDELDAEARRLLELPAETRAGARSRRASRGCRALELDERQPSGSYHFI